MMNSLLKIFKLKKNISTKDNDKPIAVLKTIGTKNEEDKSSNIKKINNKSEIKNINDNNSKTQIKSLKEQIIQNRNRSKKTKKNLENNNQNNNQNNNINKYSNINKQNDNPDKIDLFLKTKMQSINSNIKTSRNFLQASINEYEFNDFNNKYNEDKEKNNIFSNHKENNLFNNELKPRTELKKIKALNPIDEREELKDKNNNKKDKSYNINQIKNEDNENIFKKKQKNEIKKNDIINIDKKQYINENDNDDKYNGKGLNIKSDNNNNDNILYILVPLTNYTKENNCFLNVLIQALFNLEEFREQVLKLHEKAQNKVVKELCELLISYKKIQEQYKYNNQKIEPTISVNLLRKYLNDIYGNYTKGECGDPMETLEHLFGLIHKEYISQNPTKEDNICHCPSHNYCYLELAEIKMCKLCFSFEIKSYNEECYIFNIFVYEIIKRIRGKNQNYNSYKLHFFPKIKEQNEIYENENKTKITNCKCTKFNYSKKIKIINTNNPYLVINITWAEEFPNMIDILTIFCLLPMSDKYKHLFDMEDKNIKMNKYFYIKSIILYGIYHYICVIYINTQKRWAILDDKTIKYIDKYYNLVDYLLKNHLMPVGLIYSQNKKDIIEKDEIKSNIISNEEYLKLYKFCQDVENRRELKITNIAPLKGSFNETNENYLNNNLFYNSVVNLINSSSDSDYEECKKIVEDRKKKKENNKTKDKKEDNKEDIKEDEDNKEYKKIDINNNKNSLNKNDFEQNNIQKSYFGMSYMGDFNENNLRGGLIILSTSFGDEDNANNNLDNNIDNNMENNNMDKKTMNNNNIKKYENKKEDY